MADNYPAGVDSNHPHFSDDEEWHRPRKTPFQQELEYSHKLAERWKAQHQDDIPHEPICQCEECICPF